MHTPADEDGMSNYCFSGSRYEHSAAVLVNFPDFVQPWSESPLGGATRIPDMRVWNYHACPYKAYTQRRIRGR